MSKLYIVGEISWEAYEKFSRELTKLEITSSEIEIELASDGGDSHAALAFSARIRKCTKDVHITAFGNVASAAVLILASGDNRRITSECHVMVHEDQATLEGSVSSLTTEIKQLRVMENQWAELLSYMTITSAADWRKLHKHTTYLSAAECLELGLVDEII